MKHNITMKSLVLLYGLCLAIILGCGPAQQTSSEEAKEAQDDGWITLFNGKDLTGWNPKFAGQFNGVNYKNTFQAEDGVLRVSYSEYDSFRNEFGHLFYNESFTSYILQLEYRFTGEQPPGAASWGFRNNGVMIFCQAAFSMHKDQNFPVSVEVQLLGGNGTDERPTANVCTPGTHVFIQDTLEKAHCVRSTSKTFHGDDWVKLEVVVLPDRTIHHIVEGDTVFTYKRPILGGEYLPEHFPMAEGTELFEGFIALQAESHPTEFRNIRIKRL